MTGGSLKACIGDAIVCPRGHKAGQFIRDVSCNQPVRLHMLSLDGPKLFRLHAYSCCDCDEPVAFQIGSAAGTWKVRTPLGWIE